MAKDTRTRMLETTARLLQLRGYHGTALNDILAQSGAPRGSLYFHFPGGKDQLVLESTRAAAATVTRQKRDILDGADSPVQAIREFATVTAALVRESDYTLSCPIAPIVFDAPGDIPDLAQLCQRSFQDWIGLLRDSFVKAGLPAGRARALALLTQSALEGVLMISRAYRDVTPILTAGEELANLVDAALRQSTGKAGRGKRRPAGPSPRAARRTTKRRAKKSRKRAGLPVAADIRQDEPEEQLRSGGGRNRPV